MSTRTGPTFAAVTTGVNGGRMSDRTASSFVALDLYRRVKFDGIETIEYDETPGEALYRYIERDRVGRKLVAPRRLTAMPHANPVEGEWLVVIARAVSHIDGPQSFMLWSHAQELPERLTFLLNCSVRAAWQFHAPGLLDSLSEGVPHAWTEYETPKEESAFSVAASELRATRSVLESTPLPVDLDKPAEVRRLLRCEAGYDGEGEDPNVLALLAAEVEYDLSRYADAFGGEIPYQKSKSR